MKSVNKACPVVVRNSNSELLVFEHPLAGNQVVKGTIDVGESLQCACERELLEESGVCAKSSRTLGSWEAGFEDQMWGFCLMALNSELPDSWIHHCLDDGGHTFRFYWLGFDSKSRNSWHPLFRGAVDFIQNSLVRFK